jgi:hypothetical protein
MSSSGQELIKQYIIGRVEYWKNGMMGDFITIRGI